jgi:hypothetical protein
MARHALSRVFASQTVDGCFREGACLAGMPGTAVTSYNLVSLLAINVYWGHTQDPAALEALARGWRWWYDFLLPNITMPPALTCRTVYAHGMGSAEDHRRLHGLRLPAYFFNRPEIRDYAERGWQVRREREGRCHTGPYDTHFLAFLALQYDMIEDEVASGEPAWPEYRRMVAEEACVRRRHGWHAVLCGITNRYMSSVELTRWRVERQHLVNLYHEDHGLIAGAAHSHLQEELSTFTVYRNGAAYYLPEHAYLKSTPPLDTLHLVYGGETAAVSVDTNDPAACRVWFSLQGEQGRTPERHPGHPMSAMGARGRLALRPAAGSTLTCGERTWELDPDVGIQLRLGAGEVLDFGGWTLCSPDAAWEFRWPVLTSNPYVPLEPGETLALAEMALYHRYTERKGQPTGHFVVGLK